MKVCIRKVPLKEEEQVIIECVKMTQQIEDIRNYVEGTERTLSGVVCTKDSFVESERQVERFALSDVFYFEAVDEHVFAYTKTKEYEIKMRLYEVEEQFSNQYFVRCSKSVVLNMMKLGSISPALNRRFYAHMKNGEKLVISRQYASAIKKIVMGVSENV